MTEDQQDHFFALALANPEAGKRDVPVFALMVGLLTLAIGLYSISAGFVWDEGFHLLAAQLLNKGRTLWIDFCFPQTPLNAFWNAALMRWTHHGWRITHVAASLEVGGAIALIGQFVFSRLTALRWQSAATGTAILGTGLNSTLWKFGTCAQAYGMGTLLSVAAFRAVLFAVGSGSIWGMLGAGLLAGSAATSTLLTAPLGVALFFWILVYSGSGKRLQAAIVFVAGYLVPFLPIFVSLVRAPKQTWFNVVQYQAIFRRVNWTGATAHDFDVLTSWLNDAPTLLLGLLAVAGIAALRQFPSWTREQRAEFYLCGWITAGFTVYIATAHPTFQRYFVFAAPFLAALAAVGSIPVFSRLGYASRPMKPALILNLLLILAFAKSIFDDRDAATWQTYREITSKIRAVTPPGKLIYADEHVYFLMNLTPPPGMEFSYSHKLELPAAEERAYHIISEKELNEQVRTGRFATVESCKDDRIEAMQLEKLFPKQEEVGDCSIFSGPIRTDVPPIKPGPKEDIRDKQ